MKKTSLKVHAGVQFDEGDFRQILPMFQGENFKTNLATRDKLIEFAKAKGCTLPQLALAWLLALGKSVIPIPGTRHIKNLKNNLGSLEIKLTTDELKLIEQIVTSCGVKGTRYPWEMFRLQNIKPPEA